MVPELPIAMLACARLGAPHTVVFGGFSSDALSDRLNDMGCELLITQDEGLRNGGTVPLKANADAALAESPGRRRTRSCTGARAGRRLDDGPRPLVARARREAQLGRRELPLRAVGRRGPALPPLHERNDGEAEGIAHTTGGYLVGTATTHYYIFDVKPDSVYWCAADIGWVTGHSYIVYGPLCNGTTGVIYEGVPNYPDKDRWWAIIERYKVDILYTAPTAIRRT
jgi:acetyl-CoA synthetase